MVIVEYGLTRSKKRIESEFIMTQPVHGNDEDGAGMMVNRGQNKKRLFLAQISQIILFI